MQRSSRHLMRQQPNSCCVMRGVASQRSLTPSSPSETTQCHSECDVQWSVAWRPSWQQEAVTKDLDHGLWRLCSSSSEGTGYNCEELLRS